jgi:ACS family hexuronate transporter-like MFS transporter
MMNKEYNQRYAWVILGVLFFAQVVLSLGAYAWGPLGPYLIKTLSLSSVQFGSFTSTLYLFSVICSIPSGICVDRWGVKINLLLCMLLMGTALILASFVHNYIMLLILIAFVGASYGMINPVASKGLTLWFNVSTRGTAFGIRQMGVTAGGAIAGVLLIYIAKMHSWNMALLVVGVLSIITLLLCLLFYKEFPENIRPSSRAAKKHANNLAIVDLIKNRNLLLSCLIMALLCIGQSSTGAFLVLYLKENLGFSTLHAGSFLTIVMVSGGAARIFWGILSDRVFGGQRLQIMKIICFLAAISSLAVVFWTPGLPSYLFVPVVVFFGFSYFGFQGIAVVLIVEVCGPELAGRATGVGVTIAWIGMVIGPVIYGAIVPSGYQFSWLFIAIVSFISVLLCYVIDENKKIDV